MMYWWKHVRRGGCGTAVSPGYGGHLGDDAWWERRFAHGEDAGEYGGGSFGVRRPLRFLAYKLGLSEAQVGELARILADLKTERAQAAVDHRRTVVAFADAIAGDAFDRARAGEGADLRVKSAERLREAVIHALERIHAVLQPHQRAQLAYLIRTGTLTL
jgi:Spy/CpxP family protein refolding chaperone